ncbi:hypothetical protein niasHT_007157 [Heterodera trifolii]|uniref:Uncharacterized protein n=1 Tax=Heterodera trifolii TaxID=157864 RepID=A0ABD2LLS4_9BILA
MVVLSKLGSPLRPFSNDYLLCRFQAFRNYAIKKERPPPAKFQVPPPANETGHWKYERDYSYDLRYSKPINKYSSFTRFIALTASGHKELWALFALLMLSSSLAIGMVFYSMGKIEVWIDRSTSTPPWDWARVRDKYWKLPTLLYDPTGITHVRLSPMEKLQDEMLEAAKERGTRDAKGYWGFVCRQKTNPTKDQLTQK